MPLFSYQCKECEEVKETFKKNPTCECTGSEVAMEKFLSAPGLKMMEPRGPEAKERGKSVLKNQNKMLRERTRNHSRDCDLNDLIQTNAPEVVEAAGWLNSNRTKRRKIDDI